MKDNFLGKIQFYNAYSRFIDGKKETYEDMVNRVLFAKNGLFDIGNLNEEEKSLVFDKLSNRISAGGGRSFWIAGTEWLGRSNSNHFAPFNCISMLMDSPEVFGYAMNLGMQGCGVGEVVETQYISQLPPVKAKTKVLIVGEIVSEKKDRLEDTIIYGHKWFRNDRDIMIVVGDSRQGWVDAYQGLIDIAFGKYSKQNVINVIVDVSNIRGYGNRLNGFGGVANPSYIRDLFVNVSSLLNQAVGRQLDSLEVILILEEAAKNTVSGNIRRVAGMKQGSKDDALFITAKQNLWQKTDKGWRIDPARDGLRMSNHTVVYHTIPTLEEIKASVRSQFLSGEGAIQYAPEAIARGNADVLDSKEKKEAFIKRYIQSPELGKKYLASLSNADNKELEHRMNRYGLNPCAEALGTNFRCNLATVFLSRVGKSLNEQIDAFKAAALQAVPLLHLEVDIERFRYSHKIDPMILVSATHINEWFLRYFGTDWLDWWFEGRPDSNIGRMFKREESNILFVWRKTVETTISAYCARNGLDIPNRMTGIKPEGSLGLTASDSGFCGVHFPPSGFIHTRRKTFSKNDPVALAAIEYGYPCVPSPDSKDENGYLLDDPFDPRVGSWLIEVPIKESIVDEFPRLADVDIGQIPAIAMFDWVMQVQKHYSRHSTSCTINLRESEIDPLSEKIYSAIVNNDGYISAALLARAEDYQTFPRMAYEKISLEKYNEMQAEIEKKSAGKDFDALLQKYLDQHGDITSGEVACSSEICEIK